MELSYCKYSKGGSRVHGATALDILHTSTMRHASLLKLIHSFDIVSRLNNQKSVSAMRGGCGGNRRSCTLRSCKAYR